MGSRVGKELAYTLFPPALQSGIAALPLCLRWPSLAPHLPDSFPAPEKPLGVGRMGGGLPSSVSASESPSVWLWGTLRRMNWPQGSKAGLQSSLSRRRPISPMLLCLQGPTCHVGAEVTS